MTARWVAALVVAIAPACANAQEESAPVAQQNASSQSAVVQSVDLVCRPTAPLEGRSSPYDSTLVTVGGETAKICYGRPSLRGRQMIGGGAVPYDRLWRTGANEPTIIHLPFAATIAGIAVDAGSYSIYTVPGEREWTVVVNRSTSQWGHESRYTAEVQAQEVGRATVPAETLSTPVEMFTIRSAPRGAQADVVLEWDRARVVVPIARR